MRKTKIRMSRILAAAIIATCLLSGGRSAGVLAATNNGRPWVFAVPPRGESGQQRALYLPLVRFLESATQHAIRFHGSDSWFEYGTFMATKKYDLIFDGPQFTAWRDNYRGYRPLVHLKKTFQFDVIARADSPITKLSQLSGRPVCANAFPNLATIILFRHASGIAPPILLAQHGPKQDMQQLLKGSCQATVIPAGLTVKIDPKKFRVLYTSQVYPNLALSVGPQIPKRIRKIIQTDLLSPQGELLARRLFGDQFVWAHRDEYSPYTGILGQSTLFNELIAAAAPGLAYRH
ncbi:MAG: phosphate/phosphite/phosphonate ABC transporter substrate-binding protein [Acidiferrobacterales bacterium]